MPRGLGEDPLSRKRRSASTRKQSNATGSASMTAAGADGPGAASQSFTFQTSVHGIPAAPAYNEVFFQRRADDGSTGASMVGSITAVPEPVEVVTTIEAAIDTAPPAPEAAPPVESAVSAPAQEVREAVAPLVETTAALVEVKPTEAEIAPPDAAVVIDEPPQASPENQKTGFFNRIFGKFRR